MPLRLFSSFKQAIPSGAEGVVWWLALVMASGITAVLPVLPLYAEQQGADIQFIGLMVAAYMACNLAFLYPAGWLSDRLGRRLLMALGLSGFGLASLGFLLFRDPWVFVLLRGIEGIAGACFQPAALAYVADRAPEGARGARIAQLTVAQNLGLLLGPVFGGALAMAFGLGSPFFCLALLCLLGGLLVVKLPEAKGEPGATATPAPQAPLRGQVDALLLYGLSARAFTAGIALGLYETVWPLYMTRLGGTPWDISMSWTLFALPAVLLARVAGRTIDRRGPAWPAVIGGFFSATVTVLYALAGRVDLLLLLCVIEGIGFAFAYPANSTLNVQAGSQAVRGRIIGIVTAVGTLGSLLGALVMPPLYTRDPLLCFYLTAAMLLGGTLLLAGFLAAADQRRRRASVLPPADPLASVEGARLG